jgi:tetratricopeptide (TPR) repeat protein
MKYNPAFLDDETLIRSFVVRNVELARILEVIRDNTDASNQHVLIIGPRGIGKTTLVLRSAAEVRIDPALGSEWHPVVFGEETYQVSTPGEFWLEALFLLGQQTGEARWQQAYEELLRERDEDRLCGRAIAQLMDYADAQGKRLLLVVENLNMLIGGQISSNAAWVLRKTLMNEPRLMLLGTATSRFDAIDEYNQALYELFRIIEVEPLDQEEAQALWSASTGQDAPANRIRPLQILTGGNPRLIRILSEFAAKTTFSSLMDDLTRLVDEHTEYFKHHLDSLPPQERKVFVVLADLWDPSTARKVADAARLDVNTTSALLKRLMERGAVTAPYKRGRAQYYQVAERMYNVYHLMRRRRAAATRVHAVVRFMVSLYRDEELVRTTQSLVEEASGLGPGQRQDLFLAYEAIVHQTRRKRLTRRIVEATRHAFKTMPDTPVSLLELIGLTRPRDLSEAIEKREQSTESLRVGGVEDVEFPLQTVEKPAEHPDGLVEAEAEFRKALARDPERASLWHQFAKFQLDQLAAPELALISIDRALALGSDDAALWYDRGTILGALGRDVEALESYHCATTLDPQSVEMWHEIGVVHGRLDHHEEALESFDRVLTLDAEDASAWCNRGVALARLGREQEALDSFDCALGLAPQMSLAHYNKGISLSRLGRELEALESFNRALILSPETATTLANRGITLGRLGHDQEALESFDRALALAPEEAGTWYNRGVVLKQQERNVEALESLDRALALNGDNANTWAIRALVLGSLGRDQAALESSERALVLNPEDTNAWLARGNALSALEREKEALESYERALDLNPDDADMWYNKGQSLGYLAREEEALEAFDRALTLAPTDTETWFARGFALIQLGREEEALESYDRVLMANVTEAHVWAAKGVALSRLKRDVEALEAFDCALSQVPEDPATWLNRGNILTRLGRELEALDSYDRALALTPESGGIWYNRGIVLDRLGRDYEALESYNRALALEPSRGSALLWRAKLLGKQGEWKKAVEGAPSILRDDTLLKKALDPIIEFLIGAVAAGEGNEVLRIINASGRAETLEPLVVAIQCLAGTEGDVAREVVEVANDVVNRIEKQRTDLRSR